jgi:hypothetical protein
MALMNRPGSGRPATASTVKRRKARHEVTGELENQEGEI